MFVLNFFCELVFLQPFVHEEAFLCNNNCIF